MKFDRHNTFCISVRNATERRKRMISRFGHFNMDVTMYDAVTPETLKGNFVQYLNSGQKACSESHMNLWKHIVSSNLDYALVLEDDAMFDLKWREKLDELQLDDTWDAIFLNASESLKSTFTWVSATEQYLTGGYIISYKGAEALINMFSSKMYSADWMTSRLQTRGKCYTYFPWLIIQEGHDTTIGGNVKEDHAKVLRCLSECEYSISNYI